MLDGDGLHDHSSQRCTEEVSLRFSDRVQNRHRIRGHVAERVTVGPIARESDVAIVETNDPKTLPREFVDESRPIGDALVPKAVDEDQERVDVAAEHLVVDLD